MTVEIPNCMKQHLILFENCINEEVENVYDGQFQEAKVDEEIDQSDQVFDFVTDHLSYPCLLEVQSSHSTKGYWER